MTTDGARAAGAPVTWTFPGKHISVTSYKRDGTGVATPVWFVQEGDRLLFRTGVDAGKAKRIRRSPAVLVAACTIRGELLGQQVSGVARVLSGSAADDAKRLINRKYRAEWVLARTWWFVQTALHLPHRPRSTPVFLAIAPR